MYIVHLPLEIQNKLKYYALEHPVAQACLHAVALTVRYDDNRTWIGMAYEFNDDWIDFTTTEQEYDVFDKQNRNINYVKNRKQKEATDRLNHFI